MKLTLYVNSADSRVLDKTPKLRIKYVINGTLKNGTSMLNPSIILDMGGSNLIVDSGSRIVVDGNGNRVVEMASLTDLTKCNYAYINEFDRYYFISDIVALTNRLFQVNMNVDDLMSHRASISNLRCLIARNEKSRNDFVEDKNMQMKYDYEISYDGVLRGDLVNTVLKSKDLQYNIVANIIQDSYIPESDIDPIPTPTGTLLPTINPSQFVPRGGEKVYCLNSSELLSLGLTILSGKSQNESDKLVLSDFVKSIVAYPFEVPHSTNKVKLYLGYPDSGQVKDYVTKDDISSYTVNSIYSDYLIVADFTLPKANSYLDLEPYAKKELFIPFYGFHELNLCELNGHRLLLYYSTSCEDGSSNVYLYDYTKNRIVFTSTCQLGVKLGIVSTNNDQITTQRNANGLNLGVGLIGSAISTIGNIVTGNPIGVVGGIYSAVKQTTTFINSNAQLYRKAQATFNSGISTLYGNLDVFVKTTTQKPIIDKFDYTSESNYADYLKSYGAPLYEYRKLNDDGLGGFTICDGFRLDGLDCTDTEKSMIDNHLRSGIILGNGLDDTLPT